MPIEQLKKELFNRDGECKGPYCQHETLERHYIMNESEIDLIIEKSHSAGKKEAIEEIKKYLTEYMKKLCWTDRDIKYLLDDIKL